MKQRLGLLVAVHDGHALLAYIGIMKVLPKTSPVYP
jgi:hypothetical protein